MSDPPPARQLLEACVRDAIAAVDAGDAVKRTLEADSEPRADGRGCLVLAAGKAAAAMAAAAERNMGPRGMRGLVVTKDGHGRPLASLALRESGHPVPDARGAEAARELLDLAAHADPDERLWVLLSGGASSLLTCPQPGLELEDLAETTRALLACGAEIDQINTVRKHLTAVSGGRLARAARSGVIEVLVVSDVLGDRLDVIASGPCAADPSTFADALAVFEARGISGSVPRAVSDFLARGAAGHAEESVKPGDPLLERVRHRVIATNRDAREAARAAAERRGVASVDLGEVLRGEARSMAGRLLSEARSVAGAGPCLVIAGGETTVTLRGEGRGGRSQELALAAALECVGHRDIAILAAGTDGTDGPTDAAGAYADGATVSRGAERGVDAAARLDDNDAYGFFAAEGGLLHTGPTGTNVMDLALVWVGPMPAGGGRE